MRRKGSVRMAVKLVERACSKMKVLSWTTEKGIALNWRRRVSKKTWIATLAWPMLALPLFYNTLFHVPSPIPATESARLNSSKTALNLAFPYFMAFRQSHYILLDLWVSLDSVALLSLASWSATGLYPVITLMLGLSLIHFVSQPKDSSLRETVQTTSINNLTEVHSIFWYLQPPKLIRFWISYTNSTWISLKAVSKQLALLEQTCMIGIWLLLNAHPSRFVS